MYVHPRIVATHYAFHEFPKVGIPSGAQNDNTSFWIQTLKSPVVRDIMRLDIPFCDPSDLSVWLKALEKNEIVPNLRTLAFRDNKNVDMSNFNSVLAARNPAVRMESFMRWEWDFPEKVLEGGLDVVVLK
ncbi:hypothetical protein FB45DRAFT_1017173 [Roridomyces roridus]|uniref:Uncharacterized protein n=1 Tax=Roridomyces roridus TaxID=1738132 RepID=A0AAD7CI82_9AGAR|nr:hypothetical protein FB45DRAFT_1017173 [Roridomyces roridus]